MEHLERSMYQDLRMAAYLGDKKAVSWYGQLMRQHRGGSSSSSSSSSETATHHPNNDFDHETGYSSHIHIPPPPHLPLFPQPVLHDATKQQERLCYPSLQRRHPWIQQSPINH